MGAQKNHLNAYVSAQNETVLLSTQNINFGQVIKQLNFNRAGSQHLMGEISKFRNILIGLDKNIFLL